MIVVLFLVVYVVVFLFYSFPSLKKKKERENSQACDIFICNCKHDIWELGGPYKTQTSENGSEKLFSLLLV